MSDDYRAYVLAELRCAVLRARLNENDLTAIAIALKAGLIDTEHALEHLHDCGVLRLVAPPSAPDEEAAP